MVAPRNPELGRRKTYHFSVIYLGSHDQYLGPGPKGQKDPPAPAESARSIGPCPTGIGSTATPEPEMSASWP